MKKRWLLKLGLFACLALSGFWFVLWWSAPLHRINAHSAQRIQIGMTEDEVMGIVRVPAGDYRSTGEIQAGSPTPSIAKFFFQYERRFAREAKGELVMFLDFSYREWLCDTGGILIGFDSSDQVELVQYVSFTEPILDKLRRWLRIR